MNTVQVKVEQGILRGEVMNSCTVFKGVPYAKPPVGDLRFKAPQPAEAWAGVRDATTFGNCCPQIPSEGFYEKEFHSHPDYPFPMQDEDCLYLNVWAPEKKSSHGYPVALWIHGGGFDHGYGSEMEFDGTAMANRDVVLVTINYRVGIFGFLALEELRRENYNASVGNYGILDQLAALRWVRKNIDAFGGNPDNITVFGQSAGAMSVQTLISSPLSRGMISGAIIQSGGGYKGIKATKTVEEAFEVGRTVQELLGVQYARELRNMPAEKFVSVLPELYERVGRMCFGPVVDGWVLEENLADCLEYNRVHNIPYIIGCTSNDITVEEGMDGKESLLYKSCIDFAKKRNELHGKPVYVYYFSRNIPGDDHPGAFHSSELWYMFGTLERSHRPMERRDFMLSRTMLDEWCTFFKEGKPIAGWQAYDETTDFVRRFM